MRRTWSESRTHREPDTRTGPHLKHSFGHIIRPTRWGSPIIHEPHLRAAHPAPRGPVRGRACLTSSAGLSPQRRCARGRGPGGPTPTRRPGLWSADRRAFESRLTVAVDPMGGRVYWVQTFGAWILRAELNGDNTETLLDWPVLDDPVAIAIDPASLSDIPTVSE